MALIRLPSPSQIKKEFPLSHPLPLIQVRRILERQDDRLALLIGPCSIHDPYSALEFATRLKALSEKISNHFFPIMRFFIEKPRTRLGWKGMLYDPHLDGSSDILTGIRRSRSLLLQINEMGIPCAMELLEPLAISYFDDLITWGLIGARTSASQPHRQMASSLPFPVGFKNDCKGDVDVAVSGILSGQMPHSIFTLDPEGHIAATQTSGNPWTHLVLRGSDSSSNYDPKSIEKALASLKINHLPQRLVIDCSHGNCGKDPEKQKEVFESVFFQAKENRSIAGLMLESHLYFGKQPISDELRYGVSITDPCLGWEETENLLLGLTNHESLSILQI